MPTISLFPNEPLRLLPSRTEAHSFRRGDLVKIVGTDEARKLIGARLWHGARIYKLSYLEGTIQEFTSRRGWGYSKKRIENTYAHLRMPDGIYSVPVTNLQKVVDTQ